MVAIRLDPNPKGPLAMGFNPFAPKYPDGATPAPAPRKPSRREIRETQDAVAQHTRDYVTEDALKRNYTGPHTRVEIDRATGNASVITDHPHYHSVAHVPRESDGTYKRPVRHGMSRRYF